jgi:hypothetical protein
LAIDRIGNAMPNLIAGGDRRHDRLQAPLRRACAKKSSLHTQCWMIAGIKL